MKNRAAVFSLSDIAEKLFGSVYDNVEMLDEKITACLKGWTLQRIPKVSLAILRLGVCEILFFDDVPDGVCANEAVELAKIYSTDKSPSYINGILATIISKREEILNERNCD